MIVLLVAFGLLARWQLSRALGGNGLSWAYTFEWPLFGIYAIYVWWRILHEDLPPSRPKTISDRQRAREASAEAERSEYNAYLAALQRGDRSIERREA